MTETEKTKAAAGWHTHPKEPAVKRYWNGDAWTEARYTVRPNASSKPRPLRWTERPEGLMWGAILLAIGMAILVGIAFRASDLAGIIVGVASIYFASALFVVGLIAKGVELGIRAARHRPDLDF